MTSIYDIPYEDIKKYLLANNKDVSNNREVSYNTALGLFKSSSTLGHTHSIIEWIMAYNLLLNKTLISKYSFYELDNMSQSEINKLAKNLTMKGNNMNNIKNILKYLNLISDEKITLLPEIKDLIFDLLDELEKNDINNRIGKGLGYDGLGHDGLIQLLKTHRNKKMMREIISDNIVYGGMESIAHDGAIQYHIEWSGSFIIDLIVIDEIGLAELYYRNVLPYCYEFYKKSKARKLCKTLSMIIIDKFRNNDDILGKLFKMSCRRYLFKFYVKNCNYELEERFLRTAIKLKQSVFIILMLHHLNDMVVNENLKSLIVIARDTIKSYNDIEKTRIIENRDKYYL